MKCWQSVAVMILAMGTLSPMHAHGSSNNTRVCTVTNTHPECQRLGCEEGWIVTLKDGVRSCRPKAKCLECLQVFSDTGEAEKCAAVCVTEVFSAQLGLMDILKGKEDTPTGTPDLNDNQAKLKATDAKSTETDNKQDQIASARETNPSPANDASPDQDSQSADPQPAAQKKEAMSCRQAAVEAQRCCLTDPMSCSFGEQAAENQLGLLTEVAPALLAGTGGGMNQACQVMQSLGGLSEGANGAFALNCAMAKDYCQKSCASNETQKQICKSYSIELEHLANNSRAGVQASKGGSSCAQLSSGDPFVSPSENQVGSVKTTHSTVTPVDCNDPINENSPICLNPIQDNPNANLDSVSSTSNSTRGRLKGPEFRGQAETGESGTEFTSSTESDLDQSLGESNSRSIHKKNSVGSAKAGLDAPSSPVAQDYTLEQFAAAAKSNSERRKNQRRALRSNSFSNGYQGLGRTRKTAPPPLDLSRYLVSGQGRQRNLASVASAVRRHGTDPKLTVFERISVRMEEACARNILPCD